METASVRAANDCVTCMTMKIQNCRICSGALRRVGTGSQDTQLKSETRLAGQSAAGSCLLSHCGRLMLAPGPAAP